MDRRKNERHSVGGEASFQWRDANGTTEEQKGNLRNVSAAGLFIETSTPPPVLTEILVQFRFSVAGNSSATSITTKGHVTRVEANPVSHQGGFAVSTGRMNLHRLSDAEGRED